MNKPNFREATIDTEIADAHHAYAKASANAAWYAKHGENYRVAEREEAYELAVTTRRALFDAEAKYEGWSRFFLVQASNGHIHSSMNCHSTFPTTQWAWLPELSGLTEADAVAEYGGILCTFCFPSAPSDWTDGVNKKDAERKALDAAFKAIAKTPEGKAVKGKRELVSKHEYRLGSLTRDLDAPARQIRMAATWGDKVITLDDVDEAVKARAARAATEIVAVTKKLDKAKAQLAEAEAALNEALEA